MPFLIPRFRLMRIIMEGTSTAGLTAPRQKLLAKDRVQGNPKTDLVSVATVTAFTIYGTSLQYELEKCHRCSNTIQFKLQTSSHENDAQTDLSYPICPQFLVGILSEIPKEVSCYASEYNHAN